MLRNELLLCQFPGDHPESGERTTIKIKLKGLSKPNFTSQDVLCTHNVLSGPNLLGQLTALHCAEVQVLIE